MVGSSLVEFDRVSKRFGGAVAVEDLSLEIEKGEFLAIMGSSGCGKTTTLRMLAGLEAPSEGDIRLGGKRINDLPSWRRDTPMVWQSLALFPFLNVRENVQFSLRMRGVGSAERRRRATDWLERLQIGELAERNIAQLSGGQRQRVALARSLVTEPEILLLDEPLSALDANLKVRMQSVLSDLQRQLGITFVYVTHSHSEAFSMADRVVIMSRGRIEQIGAPREIYRAPRTRFVAEFLGSSNIFAGRLLDRGQDSFVVETSAGRLRLGAAPQNFASGDHVVFTVPGDRMELTTVPPAGGGNVLEATVMGEEFLGATATIYLETADGTELRAQKSHADIEKINVRPGQKLFVAWQADHAHVLPAA